MNTKLPSQEVPLVLKLCAIWKRMLTGNVMGNHLRMLLVIRFLCDSRKQESNSLCITERHTRLIEAHQILLLLKNRHVFHFNYVHLGAISYSLLDKYSFISALLCTNGWSNFHGRCWTHNGNVMLYWNKCVLVDRLISISKPPYPKLYKGTL